ncbi:MAG: hypothetical protein ABWJ97_00785 [Thermoproteus sp.]
MGRIRRFPQEVAEERLEKIIIMASRLGDNVVWISKDVFIIRDWGRHRRLKARISDDGSIVVDVL